MSLSSFLLTSAATKDVGVKKRGKEKAPAPTVDDSLDAVFRNSVRVLPRGDSVCALSTRCVGYC
jgi:hypothetical protein